MTKEEYNEKYMRALKRLSEKYGIKAPVKIVVKEKDKPDEPTRIYHPPIRTSSGVRFGWYE